MARRKIDYADNPDFYESITLMKAQGFIAHLLDEADVSQKELAERLGKSKASISRLLSDGRNLTLRSFGRILHALGREVSFTHSPIKGNKHTRAQLPAEPMKTWHSANSQSDRFSVAA